MRLSHKQKALALKLFGTDRLTARQFKQAMDDRKEASKEAFREASDADLLALAESVTELRKESQRYHVGPCPMGGCSSSDDGFFVDTSSNIGGCRRCAWEKSGQGAGPIGFIASLYHLSAFEARDHILGREISVMLPKVEMKKRTIRQKAERERLDFSEFMQWSRNNLISDSRLAQWAFDHFGQRGIQKHTLYHFGVGVALQWGKPFVTVPFCSNVDLVCCAVRLRQAGCKKSMTGSIFQDVSFGLNSVQGHEIGVIVEGEVNALSIWQVLDSLGIQADVLSIGSESAFRHSTEQIIRSHLKAVRSVIVWADKEKVGREARAIIANVRPDLAIGVLYSKEKPDKKGKIDANDLLISGHLSSVLTYVLQTAKPNAGNAVMPPAQTSEVLPDEHALSGKDELLCWCGFIVEEVGTEEAHTLYLQAEELYISGTMSDLFAHYEKIKKLRKPLSQASFDLSDVAKKKEAFDYV